MARTRFTKKKLKTKQQNRANIKHTWGRILDLVWFGRLGAEWVSFCRCVLRGLAVLRALRPRVPIRTFGTEGRVCLLHFSFLNLDCTPWLLCWPVKTRTAILSLSFDHQTAFPQPWQGSFESLYYALGLNIECTNDTFVLNEPSKPFAPEIKV